MGTLHNMHRYVRDSLSNLVNGLGTAKDPRMAWMYEFTPMNRAQLEAAYRSDWIARAIVDAPAEDATREWRDWQTDQAKIEKLENEEKRLDLRRQMKRALVKARLYGGSAIVMGVANQGLSEDEMDPQRVREGDLKFIAVFHQFELSPGPRERDIDSPWFNQPKYFTLSSDVENLNEASKFSGGARIHPSRVIMLTGNELPDTNVLAGSTNIWGDSVLQVVDEAVKATGVVIGGIAGMIADAKMDVINIPNLTQKLANEDSANALMKRFTLANQMKSSVNTLVLDEKETWNRITTAMSGFPPLIQEYLTVSAGAARIPVSRLIGMAKGKGLGGTEGGGEVDTRNYYDSISSVQSNELSPTLTPLDNVLLASTFGSIDDSIYYEWTPLWQMSDAEKADIANKKAVTAQADVTMALINPDVLREARINQLIEDGFYPGIEDALDEFGSEPEEPPAPTEADVQAHLGMMQKSAGTLKTVAKAAGLDKPVADAFVSDTIRKLPNGMYRLYSGEGKNLGTFDTQAEAEKHEHEVEYFKHQDDAWSDEARAAALEARRTGKRKPVLKLALAAKKGQIEDVKSAMESTDAPEELAKLREQLKELRREYNTLHMATVHTHDAFNPDQPRDEHGRWASNLAELDIGMSESNYDRYKLLALHKKEIGPVKRGTRVEEVAESLVQHRRKTKLKKVSLKSQHSPDVADLIKGGVSVSEALRQVSSGMPFTNFKTTDVLADLEAMGLWKPHVKDASPRTLYVCRKVLNGEAILRWARKQGIEPDVTADDMHVTITYSTRPVDWMAMGDNYGPGNDDRREVGAGGPRMLDLFGPMKDCLVLLFNDWNLKYRHDAMVDKGASWDWPEYQPHITLQMVGANTVDPFKIEPYRGEIVLGPEIFEEVKS